MTLGEIIKEYRTEHNLSMEEFAKRAGLSKQYVSILERNFNPSSKRPPKPTLDTIVSVASVTGTDVDSLVRRLDGNTVIGLSRGNNMRTMPSNILPMPAMVSRPRLGSIACGEPILAEQNIEGYDQIPDFVKCDFTLLCKGDSMIGARIHDGDIVCIKQQPEVENGQIAAVLVDGDEATLKRFYFENGTVTLQAENPAYPPKVFTGDDVNKARVLGLATHFVSKVR